jgi:hypothetical protein
VPLATPARAAISFTVVFSNPSSINSFSASFKIVLRLLSDFSVCFATLFTSTYIFDRQSAYSELIIAQLSNKLKEKDV